MQARQVSEVLLLMIVLIWNTASARDCRESVVEKLVPGFDTWAAGLGCDRDGGSTTGST